MRVLLTGAAGFIGGAVADAVRAAGHEVVGVDAYLPQAHGELADGVTGPRLDVRDAGAVAAALAGVDVVCHQAAMVGAGVSSDDLPLFASNNDLGTAVLLAEMTRAGVGKLVLASSMVVYGDGRYTCAEHGRQRPGPRPLDQLRAGRFDVTCPQCARPLDWETVPEDARLEPRSSYAASKVAQEHYASAWARQTGSSVIALRYHNVYGPGMPRDTPYAGVAAFFRSAIERGEAPTVFEDGAQMRDFVHVSDIAAANRLAVEQVVDYGGDRFEAFNVCSGRPVSIGRVAELVASGTEAGRPPVVTGGFREGDVRHIVASPSRAAEQLGFTAAVTPDDGLRAFATVPLRGG